jgi:magnesium transporter
LPPEGHEAGERPSADDLREAWVLFAPEDRRLGFGQLPRAEAEDFFLSLPARDQEELVLSLPPEERRSWVRLLPPDDAADLVQEAPPAEREGLLALLDDTTRREVTGLLAYAEDEAGGLMNPRFARVRPEATVDEAISYLRRQARERNAEAIYYAYVLDDEQRLLGVASFRDLFATPPDRRVRDVMRTDVVSVGDDMDQEAVSRVFAASDLPAIPVVDAHGRMKGIVTVDDIVDVVEEEATEDIQKFGGVEALGVPYLEVGLAAMVRKRGLWLSALFLGEMLTATAMAFFEHQIATAVSWRCSSRSSSRRAATRGRRPRPSSSAPWRSGRCGCATGGGWRGARSRPGSPWGPSSARSASSASSCGSGSATSTASTTCASPPPSR